MSRHVVQTALTVTTALVLAACAVPTDTEPDTAQAEEDLSDHPLPLPHTEPVRVHSLQEVGPFDLPRGATLTVIISAEWDRPAACPKTPFYLEPARQRPIVGYTDTLERRPVAPSTRKELQRWTGLDGGRYKIDIDVPGRDPHCNIVGKITVENS